MTILRNPQRPAGRRVFYLNSYGMAGAWRLIAAGRYPAHHLWGCVELAAMGYEVAMPEEPPRGSVTCYRRQDYPHLRFIRSWLGPDGIVYSGHTVLFWSSLLASLGLIRKPIVTLFYGRDETLLFSRAYRGIIALTPAAANRAAHVAPQARVAHLSWGVDLDFYPVSAYHPQWFLSCGKSRRDFPTLRTAAVQSGFEIHITNKDIDTMFTWPATVQVFTEVKRGEFEPVSYESLIRTHYEGAAAALVILQPDEQERFASGFTQVLETMALGRPVIVTDTGALTSEVNVSRSGCGITVPANDPDALASAMRNIVENPAKAAEMGSTGRSLCESYYNMGRFSRELDAFFANL